MTSLTPGPLHMLVALGRGAVLTIGAPSFLTLPLRPGEDIESYRRAHGRAVNVLIKFGLIEPIDRYDWRVSAAGLAWLAANGIAANLEKQKNCSLHFRVSNGGCRGLGPHR